MSDRPTLGSTRRGPVNDNPFVKRIGLLLLAFLVLLPVAKVLDGDDRDQVIRTSTAAEPEPATAVTTTAAAGTVAPATLLPTTVAPAAPVATPAPVVQAAPPATAAKAAAPPATAAPKKQAPATTAAKKQVPAAAAKPAPTTAPPKPKPAPTTAAPKPPPVTPAPAPAPAPPAAAKAYSAVEVEAIIREVWPDDLEEQALAIAKRESKLVPTVRNYCCYGVFAIYYEAGKKFLNSIGVTSAEQLFDPWVNVRAAFALYGIAGWQPWAL